MRWTDERIRAALDGASAVVERIHDALRVIGLRTADLLSDTATTDAAEKMRTYAVARNQMCHAAIGLVTTLAASIAGAGTALSGGLSAGIWVLVWERLQARAALRSGVSRPRLRRDRWLGDTPSYLSGINLALSFIAQDWVWFAAAFFGVLVTIWAVSMVFGRAASEVQP